MDYSVVMGEDTMAYLDLGVGTACLEVDTVQVGSVDMVTDKAQWVEEM